MSTTPTNQPVPSEKPQDRKFNVGKIDEFVTSMAQQYEDRFGGKHYTIECLRWLAQQAIAAYGYLTADSFQDGATLTLPNQALRDESTDQYYRWDGPLPKVVALGSTPENTGGIGAGAWIYIDEYLNVLPSLVGYTGGDIYSLRLQSDDAGNGNDGGEGSAATRVSVTAFNIKNCVSHGIRANFKHGTISGVYIESCNAGVTIETASNIIATDITIKDCPTLILSRYYPVENGDISFDSIDIINPTNAEI